MQESKCCFDLLVDGGWLFANIPAFGWDSVFDEVFPIYLDRWRTEQSRNGRFSFLPVDAAGLPLHGHLVWATAQWWQRSFTEAGFVRQMEVERALHEVYDTFYLSSAPARRSLFVFSKNMNSSKVKAFSDSIRQNRDYRLDTRFDLCEYGAC